jgi:hypothetical protein
LFNKNAVKQGDNKMAARWKAVIQGSNDPAYPDNYSIALDILGIFPTYEVESETQTSMNGTQIGRRKFRTVLEIDCIPLSTWDYANITTTEAIRYLIENILSRTYCRIKAANPPDEKLPERYSDATNFPLTAALLPFEFVKCDIAVTQAWASGNEKLTLTCYAKTL